MGLRNKSDYHDETTFFITTTCHQWLKLIHITNSYGLIKQSLQFCLDKYQCDLLGYVIMPNHVHLILYFSKQAKKRSDFMRDFKKYTSTHIRKRTEKYAPTVLNQIRYRQGKQLFKVWHDRFDEYAIQDLNHLEQKLNYIHQNPMQERWELVSEEPHYPWSSAAFYFHESADVELQITHYKEFF